MSATMTKRGQLDNVITYEFVCDTLSDLNSIEPRYTTIGSIAIVIQGEAGFEVYMANSQKQWINIGSAGGGSSSNDETSPITDQGTADNMILQE